MGTAHVRQAGGLEPGRGLIKTRRMTWDQIKQHLVVQFAALGAGTHGVVLQRLDEQLILTFARAGDGDHRAPERLGEHAARSEEHTSELQSLMRISSAVFCLKKK